MTGNLECHKAFNSHAKYGLHKTTLSCFGEFGINGFPFLNNGIKSLIKSFVYLLFSSSSMA